MPKYKRNHFISQGLIGFWKRPDGKVLLWDREADSNLDSRNPKSVHYRDYLYANWDTEGNRDMTTEHLLRSEVDDHAPNFVSDLVNAWPHILPLESEKRDFLLKLLMRTVLRHPTIPNLSKRSLKFRLALYLIRVSRWLSRKGDKDVAYERYGKDRVLSTELMRHAASMELGPLISQIRNKEIGFFALDDGAPNFVLGTQPFLINPYGNRSDIKFGLVIHPRILVGVYEREGPDFVSALSKDDAKRINGMLIRQSQHVVMVNSNDVDEAWYDEFGPDGKPLRREVKVSPSNGP